MENGKVIIGCRLDSKQLEKDLKNSKKELQKYEKEAEKLTEAKAKIDVDVSNAEKKIDNLNVKVEQAYQKMQREKIKLSEIPSWKRDTEEYQKQLEGLEKAKNKYNDLTFKHSELLSKYDLQIQKQNEINKKIESNAVSQSMLNDKIQETSQKLKQVKGFGNIKNSINTVNNGLSQTIKKVAKWGLALFGIRSAYNAIRGAMSTLSQYDTQMASNIEYIRYALASSLQPVIQTILNLVIKLLQYINYIAKEWTGDNLFKTADAFKNAQKNAKGLNKELQKTTASFDEMNILSDTSSSAGGGGGADIPTPNVDLTGLQGEIPGWVQWIVDNKDSVISALLGIAGGIIAIKLGADLLLGLGIGLIIAGISKTIKAIIDFIQDPSWDNFAKILEGLAVILTGVAIAMLAVNAANPVAWIILAIAAVVALAAIVIKNWDKIKNVLGVVGSWINDHIIKPIANFFSGLWNGIVSGVTWAVNGIKSIFNTIVSFFGGIINSILGFFKNIGVAVGNVISSAFKGVVNGVLGAIESILNSPIRAVNSLIGVINKIPGINLGKLSTFKLPRLAKGGIINQPGRGIPVGNAIAGERGQEGVLPLTDSQQMALLGEAIGRYVTINASITNTMNGRVISRELQKVNSTNDFAFNR